MAVKQRMPEERLEIIEKQAHRETDEILIEVCKEVRRLQDRVSEMATDLRKKHAVL